MKPSNLVRPTTGKLVTLYQSGDTTAIIRAIMHADADSARWIEPKALARLKGATRMQTLANIYALMQQHIRYRADRPGHEVVRSPAYLFHTGTGDCKSYSVAIGAFCRASGIPYRYRFTSQGRRDYHHVYVVATVDGKDVPLDAVPDNSGNYLDFGRERRYRRKADIRPGATVADGVKGAIGAAVGTDRLSDFWLDTFTLIGLLLVGAIIWNIAFKKTKKKKKKKGSND